MRTVLHIIIRTSPDRSRSNGPPSSSLSAPHQSIVVVVSPEPLLRGRGSFCVLYKCDAFVYFCFSLRRCDDVWRLALFFLSVIHCTPQNRRSEGPIGTILGRRTGATRTRSAPKTRLEWRLSLRQAVAHELQSRSTPHLQVQVHAPNPLFPRE